MTVFEKPAVNLVIRAQIALGIACVGFAVVALRLWSLQVVQREYFRTRSESNRLRTVFVPPPRGLIMDRHGRPLVKNRPAFNVELVVEDSPNPAETVMKLADILQMPPEGLLERMRDERTRRRFEPKILLKDVSRDVLASVMSRRYDLPGVTVSVVPAREYVYGELGEHVLGYLREISGEQLKDPQYASYYRMGDIVGQYGVEMRWERFLQGQRGVQQVFVNARGIRIGEASFQQEVAGHALTLTLDLDVQRAADEALIDEPGGIVAMDPRTGEILAMTSSPGFDPNMFAGEISADDWHELVGGEGRRMSNRVAQGGYPPGSVFKLIMGVAALNEGVITAAERVSCPGFMYVGRRRFNCHKRSGHGSLNFREAMIRSCDVYFYTVGQRLGVDRIHEYATRFGLGSPTGLKLVQEVAGIVPSTEWKRRHFRDPEQQRWYPGETPSVAIGQGALVVTPLQMAVATAALINGGKVMQPQLVKYIGSPESGFFDDNFEPMVVQELGVAPELLQIVSESLVGVVNEPYGTGRRSRLPEEFKTVVAGKTGTSQVVSLDIVVKDKRFEDHAWFVGYAPADNPEIVVSALVENGGSGGVAAAPRVRAVLEAYFRAKSGPVSTDGKGEV